MKTQAMDTEFSVGRQRTILGKGFQQKCVCVCSYTHTQDRNFFRHTTVKEWVVKCPQTKINKGQIS